MWYWGRCGCDGFTTTYAISTYHHLCCEFESQSGRGVQHHVMTFVSDLRQVGGLKEHYSNRGLVAKKNL